MNKNERNCYPGYMCDTNFNVQKKKEIKADNIEIFQSVIL